MLSWLLSDLWPYLATAGAALAAIVWAWLSGRASGKAKVENKALKDSAERQERGRDAVEDMHGAGRPEWLEQLRKRGRK